MTKPAARPAPRTVTVTIPDGDFAGWSATMKVDFPARVLLDIQNSDDPEVSLGAYDRLITSHNLPDSDGNLAKSLLDVEPYDGAIAVLNALGEAMAKLPPR